MNAREVIIQELHRLGSFIPEDEADSIIYRLRIAGFVILSRSEVEAIRDKALEEAAAWHDDIAAQHGATKEGEDGWEHHDEMKLLHQLYAKRIRKLKSGESRS